MATTGRRWRAGLVAVAMLAAMAPVAAADGYDAATRTAIKDVVTRQLDAIAHGDAKGAEAFAAPGIRDKFPEPDTFMAMVRKNYAPLLHPKSTQFGELIDSPHGPAQKVTVVAEDGAVWTAIYLFQQVDGQWKITGCGLQKVEGQQDI